jgi:hypothetical protein
MSTIVTYGEGGFDESKPDNNILEIREVENDLITGESTNVELITQALLNLPQEALNSLMQALQIGQNNG